MKTSVIEVPDMLSVLTVDEVEARFEEVPGVESATVNYAAGKITVRYDETLLKVADINIFVHQRGQKSAGGETQPGHESGIKSDHEPATRTNVRGRRPLPRHHPNPAAAAQAAEGQADEPAKDTPPSPAAG